MERLIPFSSRTWHLPTPPKVPTPGLMTIGLLCLASQPAWPEPHRKLMGVMSRDTRPNNADKLKASYRSNLGFHNTSAGPKADRLHAPPHWSSNSCKRSPSQILSAFKNISEGWHLYCYFFHWSYVISTFSKILRLGFSWAVNHNPWINTNTNKVTPTITPSRPVHTSCSSCSESLRIQMSTGTMEEMRPTSASFCIIFLIRPCGRQPGDPNSAVSV